MESFQKIFQELAIFSSNTNTEIPVDTGHTVFDELDMEITIKEISDAIDHLKRGKSHGLDYVLNEYFIEFKDIFLPQLCIIFNRILASVFSQHNGLTLLLSLFLRKVTLMTLITIVA